MSVGLIQGIGLHRGAMAGTVDMLHRCYMGFETRSDSLYFAPLLPRDVRELSVAIRYRQQRIVVTIDHSSLTLDSLPRAAPAITVCYRGDERVLNPGERIVYELSQT